MKQIHICFKAIIESAPYLEIEALQPRHIVEHPVGEAGDEVVREVKRGQPGHVVEAGVGELREEVAGEVEAPEVVQVPHSVPGHRTEVNLQFGGFSSIIFKFCLQKSGETNDDWQIFSVLPLP